MKTSFETLLQSEVPILIDFHATWCQPCKVMAPTLEALKKDLGETIKILKIDVDKNPSISSKFNVKSVPTLLLFKDKKQVWRQSGILPKNELLAAVKRYLE